MRDWVFDENLRPWLEITSGIVGYEFEDADWDAVRVGVAGSDSENDRWYEFPLGAHSTSVRLAREPGSAVVVVSIDGLAERQRDLVALAVSIAQRYRVDAR